MHNKAPYVSIVIAVKNERENIAPLVEEINRAFADTHYAFEIVFIDDGSNDGTFEEIERVRAAFPNIHVLQFEKNYGQSNALVAGIGAATGELVATMDGDLQNDPADFPRMIAILKEKSLDMVTGIRKKRHDSKYRRIQSKIANYVRNTITGDDITDSACAVRVFRRDCFKDIYHFQGMHRFMPTLFRMAGYKVEQVPVNHRQRRFGKAKYGMLNRVFKATGDLFAVRWMQKNYIRYSIKRKL